MIIQTGHLLLAALAALPIALIWLRRSRDYSALRLLAVAGFALYFIGLAHFALLPLRFDGDYVARGGHASAVFVLTPFFLADGDVMSGQQVLGNIALGIPFGFGLGFLRPFTLRGVLVVGLGFSLAIEALQALFTGLGVAFPSRAADINDVMLNMLGVLIGGLAFLTGRIVVRVLPFAQRIAAA